MPLAGPHSSVLPTGDDTAALLQLLQDMDVRIAELAAAEAKFESPSIPAADETAFPAQPVPRPNRGTDQVAAAISAMPQTLVGIELCHYAAAGDVVKLEALLDCGANPNCKDYDGNTPLHVAAAARRIASAKLLLSRGADPNAPDSSGRTALDIAISKSFHHDLLRSIEELRCRSSNGSSAGDSDIPDSFDRADGDGGFVANASNPAIELGDAESSGAPAPRLTSRVPPHVLVFVGLPARGKSYVSRRLERYWRWRGVACKSFHYGAYRKNLCGPFDRTKEVQADDLDKTAKKLAEDTVSWAEENGGIAVIDGTNTTVQRRALLYDRLREKGMPSDRIVFVEIVRNDKAIIDANVRLSCEAKVAKGDVADTDEARKKYIENYNYVIEHYQKYARTLSPVTDPEYTFVRVEDHSSIIAHRIEGVVSTRIVSLLQNLWYQPHRLYLTASGQSVDESNHRLGGNSGLTSAGKKFADQLATFIAKEGCGGPGGKPLLVLASSQERARRTCEKLSAQDHVAVRFVPTLDDLNYGDCDGKTIEEVQRSLPRTLREIQENPFKNAWPNGESVEQLFESRLEQHILELHATDRDVLVVAHKAVVQGLLLYFDDAQEDVLASDAASLDVPPHQVWRLIPSGNVRKAELVDLSV